jgi:hypothetical protein
VGPCPEGHWRQGGLVGHAGAVLLRKAADQAGLTAALGAALRKAGTSPVLDRGIILVSMAAAIALGATSMSDIAVLAHLAPVLGDAPSGPTIRRALDLAGHGGRTGPDRPRPREGPCTRVGADRRHRRGVPVAGHRREDPGQGGWSSTWTPLWSPPARTRREQLRPGKKGYGFHPLGAWCANTRECLAMLLRPGNAGWNRRWRSAGSGGAVTAPPAGARHVPGHGPAGLVG